MKLNQKQKAAMKARIAKIKVAMDEGLDTEGAEKALEEALEEVQALGEPEGNPAGGANDDETTFMAKLKKLIAECEGGGANDEADDDGKKKGAEDEEDKSAEEAKKAEQAKKADAAMDAKIKDATDGVRVSIEGRFRAAQQVEPITGRIDAMAFDSADAIYAHALKVGGMEPDKHDKAAYAGIVEVLIEKRSEAPVTTAADEKAVVELQDRYPGLKNIRHA